MDSEELKLASNDWIRIVDSAMKIGYTEGIENGTQSVYQDGFDKGYEEGMRIAFILGQYKGLMVNLQIEHECPKEIEMILSTSRYGSCYICKENLTNQHDQKEVSITEIVNCQRDHSKHIVQTLYNFFCPLVNEKGINIEHLKFYFLRKSLFFFHPRHM